MTPANFAATVESIVHERDPAIRATTLLRKENGKVSVKFERAGLEKAHWLNYNESLLSPELARACAPNVLLWLSREMN